jgi:RNA polymerase sigma-70 factor (ECF subfamily)
LEIFFNNNEATEVNSQLIHILDNNYQFFFRIAYNITHNVDDTEDVMQEVYIKALTKQFTVDDINLQWCVTVVKNTTIDYLRKNSKSFILSVADIDYSAFEQPLIQNDDYSYIELRLTICGYLDNFHPDIRMSMYLYLFEDKNAKQISYLLGIDYEQIRHKITKVKNQLKKLIYN